MKDIGNTLWEKFRKEGDRRDFKSLFDLYYAPLHRYAYLITGNSDDAEEVVMDFFLNIWLKKSLEISGSFEAYARRSVHNLSLNKIRDRKDYRNADISEAARFVCPPTCGIEAEEMEALVWEAVSSMSDKCQRVYFMSRRDDMSDKAIAEELGLSVKSVESYKTRVLKFLRELLKKNG